MSKIQLVKEAIVNTFKLLNIEQFDLTCVFFNHNVSVCSTLRTLQSESLALSRRHEYENIDLSHSEVYTHILNINCNGTPDFCKVATHFRHITQQRECDISIIASDGNHTTCVPGNPANIECELEKTFDYAIGIGKDASDFDRDFLMRISKTFLHGSSSQSIHQSFTQITTHILKVFTNNKPVEQSAVEQSVVEQSPSFLLPANTPLLTFYPIRVLHEKNNTEQKAWNKSLISVNHGVSYYAIPSKNSALTTINKKHILLVLDISASMEEWLSPDDDDMEPYYTDDGSQVYTEDTMNLLYQFNQHVYICPDIGEHDLFYAYIPTESTNTIDLLNDDEPELVIKLHHIHELILSTLMSNHEYMKKDVLQSVYHILLQDDTHDMLRHIRSRLLSVMNSFLKPYDRKIHTFFNCATSHTASFSLDCLQASENDPNSAITSLCIICYKNRRNIIFECGHVVMCFSCFEQFIISKQNLVCPYCRKEIQWTRRCRFVTEDMKCITDHCPNSVNIFCCDCHHVCFCSECIRHTKECVCGITPTAFMPVRFP